MEPVATTRLGCQAIKADARKLYAAEPYTCRLIRFDVTSPGKVDLTPGLGGLGKPLYPPAGWKYFDRLAVGADGNICVATLGGSGISVISPEGDLVEFVATDDPPTRTI
jgi:gluconolactonase